MAMKDHRCPQCAAPACETTRIMGTKQTFWECPKGHRWGNGAWRARIRRDYDRFRRRGTKQERLGRFGEGCR
jgi:hypothetical protein